MKGFLRSLEAVIAVLMIASTFFILFSTREQTPEFDTINWKFNGFNALKSLDEKDQLANAVLANNVTGIKSDVGLLLPPNLNYDLIICSDTCPAIVINSQKVATVHYFITGNLTTLQPKEIVLFLW